MPAALSSRYRVIQNNIIVRLEWNLELCFLLAVLNLLKLSASSPPGRAQFQLICVEHHSIEYAINVGLSDLLKVEQLTRHLTYCLAVKMIAMSY